MLSHWHLPWERCPTLQVVIPGWEKHIMPERRQVRAHQWQFPEEIVLPTVCSVTEMCSHKPAKQGEKKNNQRLFESISVLQ